ncbi:DUF3147 family protein [Desulfolucanica intricata]|uniref:DUF3147 family protein n=1 Tax=Desulfolucanica intricata TaxID=1285191 RepID=UPI000ADA74E9|nr:DUF3147 family protein [Desulfolucanica intricata]
MLDISMFAVIVRFILGGGAVVASTVIARAFGRGIGGIFAAFPAVYLAAVLTLGMEYRGENLLVMSQHISRGALVGMLANIVCALAASRLIIKKGWQRGLSQALVIWFILALAIYITCKNF